MWRRHDVADRLLEQRIVLVNGRLDDVLTDHVSRQLLLLGSTDRTVPSSSICPAGKRSWAPRSRSPRPSISSAPTCKRS